MGRHSSKPEATAISDGYQNLGGYHITRVVDPDDEFARTEWLSYSQSFEQDQSFVWSDVLGVRTVQFGRESEALWALRCYMLGYEDASDRVRVAPLGS